MCFEISQLRAASGKSPKAQVPSQGRLDPQEGSRCLVTDLAAAHRECSNALSADRSHHLRGVDELRPSGEAAEDSEPAYGRSRSTLGDPVARVERQRNQGRSGLRRIQSGLRISAADAAGNIRRRLRSASTAGCRAIRDGGSPCPPRSARETTSCARVR